MRRDHAFADPCYGLGVRTLAADSRATGRCRRPGPTDLGRRGETTTRSKCELEEVDGEPVYAT